MTTRAANRRGFALLAVLWTMIGVASIGLLTSLMAREAVATARNRVTMRRAAWEAEGCAENARAAVDSILASHDGVSGVNEARWSAWRDLDRELHAAPSTLGTKCAIRVRADGSRADVNRLGEGELLKVFGAMGIPGARAESLAHALSDWRDADDTPHPHGAEREWYVHEGRVPPRNGPLATTSELSFVRGFDGIDGLDTVFGVDEGRTALLQASAPALAALPGIGAEAVERLADLKHRSSRIREVSEVGDALSPSSRSEFLASYHLLAAKSVVAPEAWYVSATAAAGTPSVTATVELKLVRRGDRAAVVRRRSGP
jgi:general secretion pathway protein K